MGEEKEKVRGKSIPAGGRNLLLECFLWLEKRKVSENVNVSRTRDRQNAYEVLGKNDFKRIKIYNYYRAFLYKSML